MRYRSAAASSAVGRRDSDPDPFRRLVRKEISTDDYVKSLERRVREQREDTENGRTDEKSDAESDDS